MSVSSLTVSLWIVQQTSQVPIIISTLDRVLHPPAIQEEVVIQCARLGLRSFEGRVDTSCLQETVGDEEEMNRWQCLVST